jgi:hypothetical protein
MFVYSASWAFTFAVMTAIQLFLLGTPAQSVMEVWLVWPAIINSASHLPIYYWRAVEFRRATNELLCCRAGRRRGVTRVDTVTMITVGTARTKVGII